MRWRDFFPVVMFLALLSGTVTSGSSQGSAFTYQGSLLDGGGPASGLYDLVFAVYDAGTNGNLVGGPVTNTAIAISNGIFTVTLDFGTGVFSGPARWLDIGVRTNGGVVFAELGPRQPLAAVPYAIWAGTAAKLAGNYVSGDVTIDSNGVATLRTNGVPGTYYRTTFDAQGRELSGSTALAPGDIPNLDWSKITSGKPGTLAGYGIADGTTTNSFGAFTNGFGAIFNVKSFGAIGDGVANDSVAVGNAVNAWLNSATGGVLYFPAGAYLDTNAYQIAGFRESPWVSNNLQIAKISIAGDGMGSSFWLGDVTNSTFLKITDAGVFVRDISFVCPHPATGGTNTGVAQWGGNGNGEAQYHQVGFINWQRDGFYMNSFATQINGCTALACGTGFDVSDFCDEADLDVTGFLCTNAVVMLGSASPQYGNSGGSFALNRSVRIRASGSSDNIGVIVGGLTFACNISGGFEAISNCAIAIGHPFYLGPAYLDNIFYIDCTIRDFYLQSSGTNPVIRLFCEKPASVTLENVSQLGSTFMVVSMTNLADGTGFSTQHAQFTELLSDGTVVGHVPDPATQGDPALFNHNFGMYGGTNLNFQVDTGGNVTSRGLATAQWLKFTGATPSVVVNTAGAGAGATGSLDAGANDSRGIIKLVTGTGAAANTRLCTINFGAVKPNPDEVVMLTPMNNQSLAGGRLFSTNFTSTTFELWSGAIAPSDSTTNVVGYLCVQ